MLILSLQHISKARTPRSITKCYYSSRPRPKAFCRGQSVPRPRPRPEVTSPRQTEAKILESRPVCPRCFNISGDERISFQPSIMRIIKWLVMFLCYSFSFLLCVVFSSCFCLFCCYTYPSTCPSTCPATCPCTAADEMTIRITLSETELWLVHSRRDTLIIDLQSRHCHVLVASSRRQNLAFERSRDVSGSLCWNVDMFLDAGQRLDYIAGVIDWLTDWLIDWLIDLELIQRKSRCAASAWRYAASRLSRFFTQWFS